MCGGFSGCKGIILYNTEKEGDNAVYGYYEGDELLIEKGSLEDMKALQKESEKGCKKKDKWVVSFVLSYSFLMIAALIFILVTMPFRWFAAALIFCIFSYLPGVVLSLLLRMNYTSKELFDQFCRYHGAEHAAVQLMGKKGELTIEKLKKKTIYDSECGTAYSCYFIVIGAVAAALIINIAAVGILKALLILVGVIILLIINMFNPLNPFLLPQLRVVKRPGDREYELVMTIVKALNE